MTREQAKEEIISRSAEYFTRDKSRHGYVCPICGSGSGKNGTGITTKDNGRHFTCWAGCFTSADIFEIIGLERNLQGFNEQFEAACREFNIHPDEPRATAPSSADQPEPAADYAEFFKEAHAHINETDYPQRRGLSSRTIDRFKLGYIKAWKHPKAPNAPTSPRLIIPTGRSSYLARDTRAELTDEQAKYSKQKVGPIMFFNRAALQTASRPVFVVEGEIDALSIIEAGGEAVAIGTTAKASSFIEYCKKSRPAQPLLLAFDNDKAGRECSQKIADGLEELGVDHYSVNIAGSHKDANEALQKDRAAFIAAVRAAEQAPAQAIEKSLELITAKSALAGIRARIASGEKPVIIPTGLEKIDTALNGGFRAGLYVLGAVSSLGKTSLVLQIADNIAKQGKPVLYVSLEMARDELVAKILSRITYERSMKKYGKFNLAETTAGIQNTHLYGIYDLQARELIDEAIDELEARAGDLYILEGVGSIGTAEIKAEAQRIKQARGEAPVIVIDYLQIIAPQEGYKLSDKQITDKNVLELKRISRDEATPVICVSSFNRAYYNIPVDMAAFKESGAIEYSADVVIGLQNYGAIYGDPEKAKEQEEERLEKASRGKAIDIEFKILKNRNGRRASVNLAFTPMFNYFTPAVHTDEDEYKPAPKRY